MIRNHNYDWFNHLQLETSETEVQNLVHESNRLRDATRESFLTSRVDQETFHQIYFPNYDEGTQLHPKTAFENANYIIERRRSVQSELEI